MKNLTILDSKGFTYLNQVLQANNMNDLPDNAMLNKVTTGCGMTTVAITNDVPYVIAVPLQRLIENKQAFCNRNNIDMLGVYAESQSAVTYDDIVKYKGNKIMVTYDSLPKVTKALEENGRISEFKIMIDEAHHIIKSGNFRYGAINNMLKCYPKYKSFIFGTATPIDDRYQLPSLLNIPKVIIKWYDLKPVTVNYCVYYDGLLKAAAVQVINHLDSNNEMSQYNAHFFINSVQDITTILRYVKKGKVNRPNDIKIVTANNDDNQAKLLSTLGKHYVISDINAPSKKINFYTSTCFDGCDFYDEKALTYIVSNGGKSHSKIDIAIQLPQIIGRIRDSKTSGHVNLMYSPNHYFNHVTEEEFEAYTKQKLEDSVEAVEMYNGAKQEATKEVFRKGVVDSIYFVIDDNNDIHINDTALYSEMQNYKTIHNTYYHSYKERKDRVKSTEVIATEFNGIEYLYKPDDAIEIEGLNKAKLGGKVNFEKLCKEYKTANSIRKIQIAKYYPLIKEAYDKLGASKVGSCKYKESIIKKALIANDTLKSDKSKIVELLKLENGKFYTNVELKEVLSNAYQLLELDKKATATDITEYYDVKRKDTVIDNKRAVGFVIINQL